MFGACEGYCDSQHDNWVEIVRATGSMKASAISAGWLPVLPVPPVPPGLQHEKPLHCKLGQICNGHQPTPTRAQLRALLAAM